MKENIKDMSRRAFFKKVGAAGVAAAGLASCSGNGNPSGTPGEVPADKMTYRTNPKTGDKVSLLGFGMMRLPRWVAGAPGKGMRKSTRRW